MFHINKQRKCSYSTLVHGSSNLNAISRYYTILFFNVKKNFSWRVSPRMVYCNCHSISYINNGFFSFNNRCYRRIVPTKVNNRFFICIIWVPLIRI